MNNIAILRRERPAFSGEYIFRFLVDRRKEEFMNSVINFAGVFSKARGYTVIDEDDIALLISNITYITSWNMYEKDEDEISDFSILFEESINKYYAKLKEYAMKIQLYMKHDITNRLPEVKAYLNRLLMTTKEYENILENDVSNLPSETMSDIKDTRNVLFQLVKDPEVGFYEFGKIIDMVGYQFEFFSLFKVSDVVNIYYNLLFDATEKEKIKYMDLLTPVLMQYVFCCEYADNPTSLKLEKENAIFLKEDVVKNLKQQYRDVKYYVLSDDDYTRCMKLYNDMDASEFYKKNLYQIFRNFRYIPEVSSKGRVCRKDIIDGVIDTISIKPSFAQHKEETVEIFEIVTSEIFDYVYPEDVIDSSYTDMLKNSLASDWSFNTLSETTQDYIIRSFPNISGALLNMRYNSKVVPFVIT